MLREAKLAVMESRLLAEHNRVGTVATVVAAAAVVPDIKALEKELRQAKAAVKKAGRLVVDAGTDDENGKNVFLPIKRTAVIYASYPLFFIFLCAFLYRCFSG